MSEAVICFLLSTLSTSYFNLERGVVNFMKHMFVCPMDDVLKVAAVEEKGGVMYDAANFFNYTPPEAPLFPYVPAYLQQFYQQRKPFKQFLRDQFGSAFRPHDYLLALHDDATDLEAHALSELLIAGGARETLMEYRAFLLANEAEYISITGSKRAITLTHVVSDKDDTERIFLPLNEAVPETVTDAVHELDPDRQLPIYTYDLPALIDGIGESVTTQDLARNFLRIM